jgi:hypothetical protein
MERDASESDTLQLFALLLVFALEHRSVDCWAIIVGLLPELRTVILHGLLSYNTQKFLDRAHPEDAAR